MTDFLKHAVRQKSSEPREKGDKNVTEIKIFFGQMYERHKAKNRKKYSVPVTASPVSHLSAGTVPTSARKSLHN